MNRPDTRTLMRYFDGELPADEARAVEAYLEQDPKAVDQLEALAQVADFVRAVHERRTNHVDLGAEFTDSILARVGQSSGHASSGHAGSRHAGSRRRSSVRAALLFGGPLAAAAGIALFVALPRFGTEPGPVAQPPPVASAVTPAGPGADADPSVMIESFELGAFTGTIFMVSDGEQETPVVWLEDDPNAANSGTLEAL